MATAADFWAMVDKMGVSEAEAKKILSIVGGNYSSGISRLSGSSGGGGGGSTDASARASALKAYKRVLYRIRMPKGYATSTKVKGLMNKAAGMGMSGSEFLAMLKYEATGMYMESAFGQKDANKLKDDWGKLFPHVRVSKGTLAKAVANGWTAHDLIRTKQAKSLLRRYYPGINVAEILSGEKTTAEYREQRREMNNAMTQLAGRLLTRQELKTIFGRHMTGQDFIRNAQIAALAPDAFSWDTGQGLNERQLKRDILLRRGGIGEPQTGGHWPIGNDLRAQALRSRQRQLAYLESKKQAFQTGRSQTGRVVNQFI